MALVEALNALGVTLATNPSFSESKQDTVSQIMKAALAIQLAVISIFICMTPSFTAGVGSEFALQGSLYPVNCPRHQHGVDLDPLPLPLGGTHRRHFSGPRRS